MATRNTYTTQTWKNLPSEETPVSAERLTHIEEGIKNATESMALKELYDDAGINIGHNVVNDCGNYAVFGEDNNMNGFSAGVIVGAGNSASSGGGGICIGNENKIGGGGNFISGNDNEAREGYSAAIGQGLIAVGNQTVVGSYNLKDNEHKYFFIVGNGTGKNYLDVIRSNAFAIDRDGYVWVAGDVTTSYGASLNTIKDRVDTIMMTYDETMSELNSGGIGGMQKIPNIYAIRDWCKEMLNPSEGA